MNHLCMLFSAHLGIVLFRRTFFKVESSCFVIYSKSFGVKPVVAARVQLYQKFDTEASSVRLLQLSTTWNFHDLPSQSNWPTLSAQHFLFSNTYFVMCKYSINSAIHLNA